MRRVSYLGALLIAAASASLADDVRVFLLQRTDDGQVAIEPLLIPENQMQVVTCGSAGSTIDIIAPPAPGGSASLAQASRKRMLLLRNIGGNLKIIERTDDGERELPLLSDRSAYDIRVSVTSADGHQQAFLISGYRDVTEDTIGPVIDLFAGLVPMQPGDCVVCTDTYRVRTDKPAYGEVAMDHERYLFVRGQIGDGPAGDFVLDLGGGETAISRDFLPKGVQIEESHMVQYTSKGKELLKYEPGGATGKIQTILGHARLDVLRFGSIKFADATVSVMSELPDFFGRPVVGILGIDLLRRAEVVTFEYPKPGQSTGKLKLVKAPAADYRPAFSLPFATVNTHLMIRADVNGKPVSFVMDTGAPGSFLDQQTSAVVDVQPTAAERPAHGLDKGSTQISSGTARSLKIGSAELRDIKMHIGALEVFARMRAHGQCVGLLGNAELAQLGTMQIDFSRRRVDFLESGS